MQVGLENFLKHYFYKYTSHHFFKETICLQVYVISQNALTVAEG